MTEFKEGDRVVRKGSLRVGTVEYVNEGVRHDEWVGVQWDYPRLREKYGTYAEEHTTEYAKYLNHADSYCEEWNAAHLRKRALAPRPKNCYHCGSTNIRFIERQHLRDDSTPYVYVWQCLENNCWRMTRYCPDKEKAE